MQITSMLRLVLHVLQCLTEHLDVATKFQAVAWMQQTFIKSIVISFNMLYNNR